MIVYRYVFLQPMIKVQHYTRKQPEASADYTQAYNIINTLQVGCNGSALPDNQKVFRKYIYDLGLKHNKEFATRLQGDKCTIIVTRLS